MEKNVTHHKVCSAIFLAGMLLAAIAMMLRTSATQRNAFDLFALTVLVSVCSAGATFYALWSFNGGRL
jgi:hypothetical protein